MVQLGDTFPVAVKSSKARVAFNMWSLEIDVAPSADAITPP